MSCPHYPKHTPWKCDYNKGNTMKRYLVTILADNSYGIESDLYWVREEGQSVKELPHGKWLTREDVMKALMHIYSDRFDRKHVIDKLFGEDK